MPLTQAHFSGLILKINKKMKTLRQHTEQPQHELETRGGTGM